VIFQDVHVSAQVEGVPLKYIINILGEVKRQLDALLAYGRQFLSNFVRRLSTVLFSLHSLFPFAINIESVRS
jgi:hypothetical protein